MSAPPRPPPCARARTHARSNHLTSADVIAEEMCGAVQLFPETGPHYSVVPGGLRLPPTSPFTLGGYFSRPVAEDGSGAGRAGRLQVPWISPNQRQERGWEPGETGFTWRLPGQQPPPTLLPPSRISVQSPEDPSCPRRPLWYISERRVGGGVKNEYTVVGPP